jgi:hydrogenase maturation protease
MQPRLAELLRYHVATCIACVGNELARDDGVGMRVGRILDALPLPHGVYVRFFPQVDMDLIDDILSVRRLIVCDATRLGGPPGSLTVSSWQPIVELSQQPYCCHGIGLAELMRIAAELAPSTVNWDVHLVGIEAQTVDEFGTRLSECVAAALPAAVRHILELIAAPDELVQQAIEAALQAQAPEPLQAYGG